jgi:ATP-binding protein involved in chromosome partitioning
MISNAAITNALRAVIDPELGDNIVDLGMVNRTRIDGGHVEVTIALTTAGCPLRAQIMGDAKTRIGAIPGVDTVSIKFGEMTGDERSELMSRARRRAQERSEVDTDIPETCRILAIASGKGGVGKSSITANLAILLAAAGHQVGVLDADIGGFSLPRLLGMNGTIAAATTEAGTTKMEPLSQPIGGGTLRLVSMGSIAGSAEDEAIMWRGLMLNRAVQHFLEDVTWGDLDYLLIDMPPGTADVQMGLARMLPRTDVLIVTTPARAAQQVATRAADMAHKGHLRVAGVVENMGPTTQPDGTVVATFGRGGGEELAAAIGVPFLGSIPLDPAVAAGGDTGHPAALQEIPGPAAVALHDLADSIVRDVAPPIDRSGCSLKSALLAAGADLGRARTGITTT